MNTTPDWPTAIKYARPAVTRILRQRYPDFIDDALSSASLKAFKNFRSFRGESDVRTWFTRIAVREALQIIRTNRRHVNDVSLDISHSDGELIHFELPSDAPSPERAAISSNEVSVILTGLTLRHRRYLRYVFLGYSIKEIAALTFTTLPTAKSTVFRMRAAAKGASQCQ